MFGRLRKCFVRVAPVVWNDPFAGWTGICWSGHLPEPDIRRTFVSGGFAKVCRLFAA